MANIIATMTLILKNNKHKIEEDENLEAMKNHIHSIQVCKCFTAWSLQVLSWNYEVNPCVCSVFVYTNFIISTKYLSVMSETEFLHSRQEGNWVSLICTCYLVSCLVCSIWTRGLKVLIKAHTMHPALHIQPPGHTNYRFMANFIFRCQRTLSKLDRIS